MKVAHAIVTALEAEGVRIIVNLPDEITVFVAQEFMERGGRVFRPRHEGNGVLAADGFARASGEIGVCLIGPGPALTNTATALMTASKKRSPVLVLVGRKAVDVPRGDTKEFDTRRFAESAGATFFAVRTLRTLNADLREAFRSVRLLRGPVVLEIPDRDTLMSELGEPFEYRSTADDTRLPVSVDPGSEAIEQIAALLWHSRRPLLFAGRGAVEADAHDVIVALADRVGALLATSLQAREYFASHPRNLGVLGSFAQEAVADLLVQADLIIAIGVSLNPHQTGGGPIAPNAQVVHIDTDPASLARHVPVDLSIVADAHSAVSALVETLDRADLGREHSLWMTDDLSMRLEAARARPRPAEVDASRPLPASRALAELDAIMPEDRLVVLDGGMLNFFAVDQITVSDPRAWIWSVDFGSIGLSLGMAMGAAIARPDRHCVVIAGDGGLAMNMQELETLVREDVPLTVVVVNDAAYSAEVMHLRAFDVAEDLAEFPDVDFAAIARAFGMPSCTVNTIDDFAAAADLLRVRKGPVLIELKVTEDEDHRLRRESRTKAPIARR